MLKKAISERLPILVSFAIQQMVFVTYRVNNPDDEGIEGSGLLTGDLPGSTAATDQNPFPITRTNHIGGNFKLRKGVALFINILKEQKLDPLETEFLLGTNDGSAYPCDLH